MADPYRVTDDWLEGYDAGYDSGFRKGQESPVSGKRRPGARARTGKSRKSATGKRKTAKKPSAYNNFVAKKSQLPRFKYKTTRGKKKKGMVNLKAIGIAWRKLSPGMKKKWA